MVDVRLTYDKGLDRYYGLLDLALKYDIFKSVSTRIELPDGSKTFGKTINNNPEKYFTEDILDNPIKLRKSFTKNLIKNYSTSKNIDHFIWWNSDDIFGKYLSFKPEEADDLVDNGSLRTNNIFVYQLDPSISKP